MTRSLSVVIVTHDRRDAVCALLGCLAPLAEQAQVMVADAASGDGTADAIRVRFPWVREVRFPDNPGAAALRNRILPLASGDVAVLLDDDVVLDATGTVDPRCWPWSFVDPRDRSADDVAVRMMLEAPCATAVRCSPA